MATSTRRSSAETFLHPDAEFFQISLEDRKGERTVSIRLLQKLGIETPYLTPEKVQELWMEYQKHDVLFSDYTRGKLEPFLLLLLDDRSVWFEIYDIEKQKPIGVAMVSNIVPRFDARGHFAFWDGVGSGREPLAWRIMDEIFRMYDLHRMTARVPVYQRGVIRFVKRLGFEEEGEMREAVIHKDHWAPVKIFGILRSEFEETYGRYNSGSGGEERDFSEGSEAPSSG